MLIFVTLLCLGEYKCLALYISGTHVFVENVAKLEKIVIFGMVANALFVVILVITIHGMDVNAASAAKLVTKVMNGMDVNVISVENIVLSNIYGMDVNALVVVLHVIKSTIGIIVHAAFAEKTKIQIIYGLVILVVFAAKLMQICVPKFTINVTTIWSIHQIIPMEFRDHAMEDIPAVYVAM